MTLSQWDWYISSDYADKDPSPLAGLFLIPLHLLFSFINELTDIYASFIRDNPTPPSATHRDNIAWLCHADIAPKNRNTIFHAISISSGFHLLK